jgi:hypothetical protein
VSQALYDILVFPEVPVECYFHRQLLLRQPAMSECMVLVDKLDCDDGSRCVEWYGFADPVYYPLAMSLYYTRF